jgi:hypothetical protein
MGVSSKFGMSLALVLCGLVVAASPAPAARYFKDENQAGYRILLRASSNRVLSGIFIASGKRTLKCDDGGVFVGGFPIQDVKITNGRFSTVKTGYVGEGGVWRLVFRGALKGDRIRGVVSLHLVHRDPERSSECWSGKGRADPLVSYVAKAGG